ncbi:MAG: cysteine hydrolase [Candidatus Glassbacteria bacterium]|nr:cysteine hydrolase [Candidatus Glassbacteria bacterium]
MTTPVDLSAIHEQYITPETLDARTESYLGQLADYSQRRIEFVCRSAALVLVDLQRCFLDPGFHLFSPNCRTILPRVAALLEFFRNSGRPVLYTLQKNKDTAVDRGPVLRRWWPSTPLENSPDTEPVEGVLPLPEEKVIHKRRYSGFYATDLELTLRSLEVSQVVVSGVFTNVCVEATVRDAFMRDFFVFLPADATAAHNELLHLGSLRTMAMWFATVCRVSDLTGE